MDDLIISTDNPQVRLARSLLEASGRRRHGAFLVEGTRGVEAAAAAPLRLALHAERYGRADGRERSLLRQLRGQGVPLRTLTDRVLAHVSDTVTPQGIVAVVGIDEGPRTKGGEDVRLADVPSPSSVLRPSPEAPLALVLDAVGDPGNAGTLLRSAAGAGVGLVVAMRGTVDLYSPKVVRAGAGAHFHVELATGVAWPDVAARLPRGAQVVLADAAAARPYWEADWTAPSVLIVSSEPHGASAAARDLADAAVSIPLREVESLNAGVAGSVILFEARRQRQLKQMQQSKRNTD